jgi:glutamine amidotransferase
MLANVVVIDYGMGNLYSVQRGLEHCGVSAFLTSDPSEIVSAQKLLLPGVGAFGDAMTELNRLGLVSSIKEAVERGTPILGICLGMQLLMEESEEFGFTNGLGLIPGRVIPIPQTDTNGDQLKVPHIGWSSLNPPPSEPIWNSVMMSGLVRGDSVYFVHSFMVQPTDPTVRIADTTYGGHQISAVLKKDNVIGCQFHPEKSGNIGLQILGNFCKL